MVEKSQNPKVKSQNLEVKIGKLCMKNPLMVASGTFSCDMFELFDMSKLGAVVTKTVTTKPRAGNKPPRVAETPSGMLNSIGLENEGLEGLKQKWLPCLKNLDTEVIVSIAAETEPEFVELVGKLGGMDGIDAIELNLSCPNVTDRRPKTKDQRPKLFSQDKELTYRIVKKVRKATALTLITKLTPNVTDISRIAKAAERAGSDAISLVNTYMGMAVDISKRAPLLGNVTGGLSGPAIRPIAVKAVWDVYNTVDIPIIGMGGIMDARDAIEFIICGASAVAVGTANLVNPKASIEIIDGIEYYMRTHRIKSLKELIGSLRI